jgi:hypothetical protein
MEGELREFIFFGKTCSAMSFGQEHPFRQGSEYSSRKADYPKKRNFPGFLLIAICAGGLYFCGALLFGVGENYLSSALEATSNPYTVEEDQAYHFLVATGWQDFEQGRLDNAYLQFNRALKIKLDGKEAHLGVAQTLDQFCTTQGKFCEEARRKKEFMVKTYHKNKDETIL